MFLNINFFTFGTRFWQLLGSSWASLGRLWASKMAPKSFAIIEGRQFFFNICCFHGFFRFFIDLHQIFWRFVQIFWRFVSNLLGVWNFHVVVVPLATLPSIMARRNARSDPPPHRRWRRVLDSKSKSWPNIFKPKLLSFKSLGLDLRITPSLSLPRALRIPPGRPQIF